MVFDSELSMPSHFQSSFGSHEREIRRGAKVYHYQLLRAISTGAWPLQYLQCTKQNLETNCKHTETIIAHRVLSIKVTRKAFEFEKHMAGYKYRASALS
jgi:hypothetical protein